MIHGLRCVKGVQEIGVGAAGLAIIAEPALVVVIAKVLPPGNERPGAQHHWRQRRIARGMQRGHADRRVVIAQPAALAARNFPVDPAVGLYAREDELHRLVGGGLAARLAIAGQRPERQPRKRREIGIGPGAIRLLLRRQPIKPSA